jgi:hypothetical protein
MNNRAQGIAIAATLIIVLAVSMYFVPYGIFGIYGKVTGFIAGIPSRIASLVNFGNKDKAGSEGVNTFAFKYNGVLDGAQTVFKLKLKSGRIIQINGYEGEFAKQTDWKVKTSSDLVKPRDILVVSVDGGEWRSLHKEGYTTIENKSNKEQQVRFGLSYPLLPNAVIASSQKDPNTGQRGFAPIKVKYLVAKTDDFSDKRKPPVEIVRPKGMAGALLPDLKLEKKEMPFDLRQKSRQYYRDNIKKKKKFKQPMTI